MKRATGFTNQRWKNRIEFHYGEECWWMPKLKLGKAFPSPVPWTPPVQPSRLSFAGNNSLHVGNTTRRTAQISPVRRKCGYSSSTVEWDWLSMPITLNLQIKMEHPKEDLGTGIAKLFNFCQAVSFCKHAVRSKDWEPPKAIWPAITLSYVISWLNSLKCWYNNVHFFVSALVALHFQLS